MEPNELLVNETQYLAFRDSAKKKKAVIQPVLVFDPYVPHIVINEKCSTILQSASNLDT